VFHERRKRSQESKIVREKGKEEKGKKSTVIRKDYRKIHCNEILINGYQLIDVQETDVLLEFQF
jgi:hypothetical protein